MMFKNIKVYIAGPISKGNPYDNVYKAKLVWKRLMEADFIPFLPHLSAYLETSGVASLTHAQWLAYDFEWIEVCDCLYRMPGESTGADAEVEHAKFCGIPVYTNLDDLIGAYYK